MTNWVNDQPVDLDGNTIYLEEIPDVEYVEVMRAGVGVYAPGFIQRVRCALFHPHKVMLSVGNDFIGYCPVCDLWRISNKGE
jgi:hypothetical protein